MTEATSTTPNFLELGRTGRSKWWQYLLGTLIIVVLGYIMAQVVGILALIIGNNGKFPTMDPDTGRFGVPPEIEYLAINLPFIPLLGALWLAVRGLHNRPFLTVITAAPKFRLKLFAIGFIYWFSQSSLASVIEGTLYPTNMVLTFKAETFFMFVPLILAFTTMQTFTEEAIMRGYFLQATSGLMRNPWALGVLNGILFMVPHIGTPDLGHPVLLFSFFFFFGALLALLTIKTNGLELAFGVHAANNVFDAVVMNYKGSPMPTSPIFEMLKLNLPLELGMGLAAGGLLYFLTLRYLKVWDKAAEPSPAP